MKKKKEYFNEACMHYLSSPFCLFLVLLWLMLVVIHTIGFDMYWLSLIQHYDSDHSQYVNGVFSAHAFVCSCL